MKQCKAKRNEGFNCGSYAFNLHQQGIDQGDLCDVHYYKQQRDELLVALKEISGMSNLTATDKRFIYVLKNLASEAIAKAEA